MPMSLLQEVTHLRHEMMRIVKVIGAAVGLTFALFFPSMSYAAAFQYSPKVSLEGSYNDNFRLETADPDRVFHGSSVQPQLYRRDLWPDAQIFPGR